MFEVGVVRTVGPKKAVVCKNTGSSVEIATLTGDAGDVKLDLILG